MKKKVVLLSSLILAAGIITSSIAFLGKGNSLVKVESTNSVGHQIVLTAENTSIESEPTNTAYFSLHKDNATRSGCSIDSTPGECLIAADGDRGAAGDSICFGVVNPDSGTYVSLMVSIPLTNIESFKSVVFRGSFYRGYWSDKVTEIQFGNESFSSDKFSVHISKQYQVFELDQIEINYTCAL